MVLLCYNILVKLYRGGGRIRNGDAVMNKNYLEMTREALLAEKTAAEEKLAVYRAKGLSINMARGKPAPVQLDFSDAMLNLTKAELGVYSEDGTDCRNYGDPFGIPECRRLFGEIIGVPAENVIACGNASLELMYDYISQCMTHGAGGGRPWIEDPQRKMIAVVPGYDRHFAIAERFGLEMVNVPMTPAGPDMDQVEALVKDPHVKGMFCVPKYSNPDGITYSDETVARLARMETAAPDFRVIWDEAYIVHDLYDEHDELMNVFEAAKPFGHEDRFIAVASTSKITFAGAGVAVIAASDANIREIGKRMAVQIISYDKMNQLRHAHFYKTADDIRRQMQKHAAVLRPKFDTVLRVLHRELDGTGIARWTDPRGGYFISLDVTVGSAKYVGDLCRACGLTLTNVGATYPLGVDPTDSNIRIAPSCPSVQELETATGILAAAVKLAACIALLEPAQA